MILDFQWLPLFWLPENPGTNLRGIGEKIRRKEICVKKPRWYESGQDISDLAICCIHDLFFLSGPWPPNTRSCTVYVPTGQKPGFISEINIASLYRTPSIYKGRINQSSKILTTHLPSPNNRPLPKGPIEGCSSDLRWRFLSELPRWSLVKHMPFQLFTVFGVWRSDAKKWM